MLCRLAQRKLLVFDDVWKCFTLQQSQAKDIVQDNPEEGPDTEVDNIAIHEWFYPKM